MNEHIFFAAFAALSFLVGVGCLVRALYLFKTGKRAKRVLSSIQIFTIGVFFSVLLIFIPICYTIDGQPQIHSALFACGSQFVQSLYFGWRF